MGIKITKKAVIWNYLGVFMTMGSNFLILPFMIHFLDGDSLGLWYVYLSIGGIVTLFDFGFNPTIARNVAYCWSGAEQLSKTNVKFVNNQEPNIGLLKKVLSTCEKIYFIISLIALILLLTIGTFYILYISQHLSGNNYIIAWIIYSVAVFLNLYYGYYATFLRGVGAISKVNKARIISRAIQIILSIVLLYFGLGLIAVSFAYLANGILIRMISKVYFYKHENIGERLKNNKTIVSLRDLKETFSLVWHNAWRDGLVSLSAFLSNQASILICSMYLSLMETGIYSISMQLITAVATISGALYTAFQPSLQSAYINKDIVKQKRLMSTAMTVYQLIFGIGVVALIVVGLPLLELIKSDVKFNIPILLAIALYIFLLKHHSYYASFISNTNNVPYVKSFTASSFIGIILAIILVQLTDLGVWALIVAQIIVQGVYNNWMWPKKVWNFLGVHFIDVITIGLKEIKKMISTQVNKVSKVNWRNN
ncbi:O-unit flippase-like protein [Lentibacillus sp. N15]|uniref:O-unit flippase-like protein n=1 Tax=Lentibacillus songyuanensis TaxID=3136161 RepID=UPI0031B9DB0D